MTKEKANELKADLIRRAQANVFDAETKRLLNLFCSRINAIQKLNNIDRSIEAYPTKEARDAKKQVQDIISVWIDAWAKNRVE
jgi:hypothetical protein